MFSGFYLFRWTVAWSMLLLIWSISETAGMVTLALVVMSLMNLLHEHWSSLREESRLASETKMYECGGHYFLNEAKRKYPPG